jgi:hypothetical protein
MKFHSRTIHEVITANKTYRCKSKTPSKGDLFSFDLVAEGKATKAWLILEDQGNTLLTKTLTDRIFEGTGTYKHGYNLAIDRQTGQIYTAHFGRDKSINFVVLYSVTSKGSVVPTGFLDRIDELRTKKRPFQLTLPDNILMDFLDREIGYRDLKEQLVVELRFPESTLQLWEDSYRQVGDWVYDASRRET